MHISGAKLQEHCFNIPRDIVFSVFHHFLAANTALARKLTILKQHDKHAV